MDSTRWVLLRTGEALARPSPKDSLRLSARLPSAASITKPLCLGQGGASTIRGLAPHSAISSGMVFLDKCGDSRTYASSSKSLVHIPKGVHGLSEVSNGCCTRELGKRLLLCPLLLSHIPHLHFLVSPMLFLPSPDIPFRAPTLSYVHASIGHLHHADFAKYVSLVQCATAQPNVPWSPHGCDEPCPRPQDGRENA